MAPAVGFEDTVNAKFLSVNEAWTRAYTQIDTQSFSEALSDLLTIAKVWPTLPGSVRAALADIIQAAKVQI